MSDPRELHEAEAPAIQWQIPKEFHSLALELDPEERARHFDGMAASIWSSGTDHQRETVAYWYRQIADAAAADGALEAAFCVLRTEDGRVTTANLSVMVHKIEHGDDTRAVLAGLVEALSDDPMNQVVEVNTAGGPAVLTLSGLQMTAPGDPDGAADRVTLDLAQATAYVPCLEVSHLLLLTLTTPSIVDFPDYVGVLARVADSVQVNRAAVPATPVGRRIAGPHPSTQSVHDVFG